MSSISRWVRAIEVGVADRPRRRPGQGDVDPVGDELRVELGGVELLAARLEQRLELLAGLVGGAADLAAFLRRQLGDPAQDRRSARLCGRGSGPAAPPARRWSRRRRSPRRPRPGSPRSAQASALASFIRRARYSRRGGDVQRLGAARAQGDRRGRVAGGDDLRPAAPRARPRGRGSRRRRAPRARLAAVGDERDPRRRGRLERGDPQRRPREDRAHARPHRLRPVGVGAVRAEDDGAAEQRVGGADDRADVAGVGDAVQVEAGRGRRSVGARPPAAPRPRSPASPSRARRRRPAAPARPPRRPARRRARCRRRPARTAARPRSPARPRPGPRPRSRTAPRARGASARAACGPASASRCRLVIIGAVLVSVRSESVSWNEKAGRLHGPPGKTGVSFALRRRHPPGLAPQIGGRHRGR